MCGWDGKMEEEEWMDIVGLRECGWIEKWVEGENDGRMNKWING